MSTIKYFGNKSWSDITREERYFCSHLYHSVLGREKEFVKWLNTKTNLNLTENTDWEIGYEVCFYRDYLKSNDKTIKAYNKKYRTKNPVKRTFDLCLFSDETIIILEAKAYEGFTKAQLKEFEKDEKLINDLILAFNKNIRAPEIITILLYSDFYKPKLKKIKEYIHITWKALDESDFNVGKIFNRANELKNIKR